MKNPLFNYGKTRPKATNNNWTENRDGTDYVCSVKCESSIGVPGAFDQDVFNATLKLWATKGFYQKNGHLDTNYSEIANILRVSPAGSGLQIKDALRRLAHAKYTLENSYFDAKTGKYKDRETRFSLYSVLDVSNVHKGGKGKGRSKVYIEFPQIILANVDLNFYQWLDFDMYMSLRSGLPRRLYEYLHKVRHAFFEKGFRVGEDKICPMLPVTIKHTTKRRKKIADTAQELIDVGYLKAYEQKKKICCFYYAQGEKKTDQKQGRIEQPPQPQEKQENIRYEEWLQSIRGIGKQTIKKLIALSDFEQRAENAQKEYERQKDKIKRPAAWIRNAIEKGFTPELQQTQITSATATQEQNPWEMVKVGDLYNGKKIERKESNCMILANGMPVPAGMFDVRLWKG